MDLLGEINVSSKNYLIYDPNNTDKPIYLNNIKKGKWIIFKTECLLDGQHGSAVEKGNCNCYMVSNCNQMDLAFKNRKKNKNIILDSTKSSGESFYFDNIVELAPLLNFEEEINGLRMVPKYTFENNSLAINRDSIEFKKNIGETYVEIDRFNDVVVQIIFHFH